MAATYTVTRYLTAGSWDTHQGLQLKLCTYSVALAGTYTTGGDLLTLTDFRTIMDAWINPTYTTQGYLFAALLASIASGPTPVPGNASALRIQIWTEASPVAATFAELASGGSLTSITFRMTVLGWEH